MKKCPKCQGTMVFERAVDMQAGLVIVVFACLNCGLRLEAEKDPKPVTSA